MADYPESIESTCTDAGDLNVNEDAEEHRREEQQDGNENNNEGDNERRRDEISQHTKFAVRTGIRFILFFTVLSCITFSKLTLIRLADRLRTLTVVKNMSSDSEKEEYDNISIAQTYWHLLYIILLPHCLTFVRSALFGVIGKSRHPWPCKKALIAGFVSSIVEVIAMSFFVFSVLCYLTPHVAILTMQSVFFFQFLLDIYYARIPWLRKSNVQNIHEFQNSISTDLTRFERWQLKIRELFRVILENKLMRFLASLLQILGIVGFIVFIVVEANVRKDILFPAIFLPLSIATLSIVWSNKVQEYLVIPQSGEDRSNGMCSTPFSARYKANFINSAIRIILYPIVAYFVFLLIHHGKEINLWQVAKGHYRWYGEMWYHCLAQILTSLLGYLFAWVACTTTYWGTGLALPLLLSTPISITLHSQFFPNSSSDQYILNNNHIHSVAICIWLVTYLGQLLGMAYFLFTKSNLVLSQDKDMFINPHYDGVFLEQHLALNRQVDKYNRVRPDDTPTNSRRAIFICSTMYRENVREMSQMLKSIKRMSEWYTSQQADIIESHIFFDGAVNGNQLQQYALQLVSLVNECLGVQRRDCKRRIMPYGQSMTWEVGESKMRFTVHLKDRFKVKNKKRWSQVMYMNYVINYRIKMSQQEPNERNRLHPKNTFILTTDADIAFTADSAIVLLDTLASNDEVGAVCARTHPRGAGVMYWYQVFDYAIGHWFLKPAEHIFGCVLCCPGCFSVFRCTALNQVLKEYSSEVKGASDFLTKDMGEDRWLCTLLIQKGWRLDYCAISSDHTYCPETFEEFYKQRRRWVPSTMANLLLLISKVKSITKANNSVSILFIVLQGIIAFSTAISPATVILLISSGFQGAYHIDNSAVITTVILLTLLSVLYGVICLYTSQKTQLDIAKILTFFFAILMAIVVVGIIKEIIFEVFPIEEESSTTSRSLVCQNTTNCVSPKNDVEGTFNMSTLAPSVNLPKSPGTWYIALFAVTFIIAAIFHLGEYKCLVHGIWYLLGLPSGYLLLLIYSAANLNSQSWGTREATTKADGGSVIIKKLNAFICRKNRDEQTKPLLQSERIENSESEDNNVINLSDGGFISLRPGTECHCFHKKLDDDAKEWLNKQECYHAFYEMFERHGYWNLSYIASMEKEDFKAIGIKKQGYVLRLAKAAKKLPTMVMETELPQNVNEWLTTLQMDEYIDMFNSAGYKTGEDVENLKELNKKELRKIGIKKRAHLDRLILAIDSLFHPTEVEVQIYETKRDMDKLQPEIIKDSETQFWSEILSKELKPVTVRLQASQEIAQKLKSLRNSTLAIILLINIMWLVLLYTITFPQLEAYGLTDKVFQLLFLGIYGIIILLSFVAMILHRFFMLMQFFGRKQVAEQVVPPDHDSDIISTSV